MKRVFITAENFARLFNFEFDLDSYFIVLLDGKRINMTKTIYTRFSLGEEGWCFRCGKFTKYTLKSVFYFEFEGVKYHIINER